MQTYDSLLDVDVTGRTRDEIINAFIAAWADKESKTRSTCILSNMWKVDALYNARQEARVLLELDKAGVEERIRELKSFPVEDSFEIAWKESSLAAIRVIGKKIRLTLKISGVD